MNGLLILLLAVSAQARDLTLPQAYELALGRSEALSQRQRGLEELEARISEIWSSVYPKIGLAGTQIWQDSPGSAPGAQNNTFAQTSRPQAQVTLRQPVFSGLREYLAAKSARAQDEGARAQLKRARQLIYRDVAAAYVSLLSVHLEMRSRQALVDLTEDRIKELRSREKIGRSRPGEVLAAQSQQAQAVSEVAAARGRERAAQALIKFLTGVDEDLTPQDLPLPAAEIVSPFLERAKQRPDVAAQRSAVDAARENVEIESRARWPTVALDGNYYLKRPAGFSEKIRWDATLSASVPLWDGGVISARTRQAKARAAAAEDGFSLAMRTAEREVREAHAELDSQLAISASLAKALELADANAKAQTADYRLGLVTNLEVLSALNTALETRLRLERSRLEAALARVELEVAAGGAQ